MDQLVLNPRCRLLGDLDFNPRRESFIRDPFVNGESVSKEYEIHQIYIGVILELSHILEEYPYYEVDGSQIVKIPELCFIMSKLELP